MGRAPQQQPPIPENGVYDPHHQHLARMSLQGRNGSSGSSSSSSGGDHSVYGQNGIAYVGSSSTIATVKAEAQPSGSRHPSGGAPANVNVNKTLPTSPGHSRIRQDEGTVRQHGRRDPSYGSDDSDDVALAQQLHEAALDDLDPELHPTMLDSVVIPAIASVCVL